MIRTQIQLSSEDYEGLREISGRARRSMADCIREGVALFLKNARIGQDDFSDISGRFRPSAHKGAKRHDAAFAEAARKRKSRPR